MDTHIQEQGDKQHGTPYIFFVDDQEFTIHESTITGGQIMDLAGIPRENGLIEIFADGTQQTVPADKVIELKPGQAFKKAPRFKRG